MPSFRRRASVTDTGRVEVTNTVFGVPGLHRHVGRLVSGEIVACQWKVPYDMPDDLEGDRIAAAAPAAQIAATPHREPVRYAGWQAVRRQRPHW